MPNTKNPFDFDSVKTNVHNRNGFDVSYSTLFTTPCGLMLPAYVEEVLAGDYFELGCSNFVRTQPAVAPAFVNFDEKIDFYFVPYRLLWSLYDTWRLGSNIYNKSSMGNLPSISSDGLITPAKFDTAYAPNGVWFDMMYGAFTSRQPERLDCFGVDKSFNYARIFDLFHFGLPYGVYERLDKNLEEGWESSSGLKYNSPYLTDDDIQEIFKVSSRNGYIPYVDMTLNIFRPLAYQCICQNYYRNTDFEAFVPSLYNVDRFFNAGDPSATVVALPNSSGYVLDVNFKDISLSPFDLEYKCFRHDRFNSVKPINGFGYNAIERLVTDVNWFSRLWSIPTNGTNVNSNTGLSDDKAVISNNIQDYSYTNRFVDNANSPSHVISGHDINSLAATPFGLSANDLRMLIANDNLIRSMVYSKKDYAHLREAVLGIPSRNFEVPQYLGTHQNAITLSDVEATATTEDGSTLGELAGKGIGGGSSFVFKQEFSEDGVILGIHYIMPRNNYDSHRIDRRNQVISMYDMPLPQFDNLGLQPLWMQEYMLNERSALISQYLRGVSNGAFQAMASFGFESRYGQYKSRVNEIHSVFQRGSNLDYWTLSTNVPDLSTGVYDSGLVLSDEKARWLDGLLGDSFFKIRPNITDQIFNVNYNGSPSTDPFMCSFSFNVTRVSNLSVMGVPSVNSNI